MWTEARIKKLLTRSDEMVKRSIVQLYYEATPLGDNFGLIKIFSKGKGFGPDDIRIFVPIARHILGHGFITPCQIKEARPRLYKYAKILADRANQIDVRRAAKLLKAICSE